MHKRAPAAPLRRVTGLAAALIAASLAACGGGDVDTNRNRSSDDDVAVTDCGLPDFRASVLARVNEVRAAGANCGQAGSFGAAGAVTWNDLLTQAAAGHASDMARLNFFSHTSQDGRTLADRVNATGYVWMRLGENIAGGPTSVAAVVDAWLASPDHCANMMDPAYVEVGVACVPGSASNTFQTYWVMELGLPPSP